MNIQHMDGCRGDEDNGVCTCGATAMTDKSPTPAEPMPLTEDEQRLARSFLSEAVSALFSTEWTRPKIERLIQDGAAVARAAFRLNARLSSEAKLRDELTEMTRERDALLAFKRSVNNALNEGDGSYRP